MPAIEDTSSTTLTDDLALLNDEGDVNPDETPLTPPPERGRKTKNEAPPDEEETDEEVEPEDAESPEPEPEPEPEATDFNEPIEPTQVAELKKAYPDLFKKFPNLRASIFRERQFSEIFPTLEDARDAGENNEAFSNLRDNIINGDGSMFITAIKEVGEEQLHSFAENLLTNLYKTSPEAHWTATVPLMENIVRAAFAEGKRTNNADLQASAENIAQYLLGNPKIATGEAKAERYNSSAAPKSEAAGTKAKGEEKSELQVRFETDIRESGLGELNNFLTQSLRPDPNNEKNPVNLLTDWTRNAVQEKIFQAVNRAMQSDKPHMAYMDSLWRRAKSNGWTKADQSKLISAYLDRAKKLIPSIKAQIVGEAIGTSRNVHRQQTTTITRNNGRANNVGGGGRGSRQDGNKNFGGKDPRRTAEISDRELLD